MIFIALGANLPSKFGKPEETLVAAAHELRTCGLILLKSSHIWMTPPMPASEQPWYRNAVVTVETSLGMRPLFSLLKQIESDFGRNKAGKNAPRVLDLDLLAYNDEVIQESDLVVPHPRMQERTFVLYPLKEIAPEWMHPVLRKNISGMLEDLPEDYDSTPLEMQAI